MHRAGASVFTRPSIISGKPGDVGNADDREAGLAASVAAVPPVDTSSKPRRGKAARELNQAGLVGNTE